MTKEKKDVDPALVAIYGGEEAFEKAQEHPYEPEPPPPPDPDYICPRCGKSDPEKAHFDNCHHGPYCTCYACH